MSVIILRGSCNTIVFYSILYTIYINGTCIAHVLEENRWKLANSLALNNRLLCVLVGEMK
jgi:hypothetical protein